MTAYIDHERTISKAGSIGNLGSRKRNALHIPGDRQCLHHTLDAIEDTDMRGG